MEDQFTSSDLVQVGEVIFGPGAKPHLPKLTSSDKRKISKARSHAMNLTIKMNRMKQDEELKRLKEEQERNHTARQQAFQLMCRLYIGSINFEVKEDSIRKSFLPFGPIKLVTMSWDPAMQRHKGYAFIDYELPEAAQLALEQMNNSMISGRNIKVISQSSNMPQAQPIIEEIKNNDKNYPRIYIASIHPEITEKDIRDVFEAFGSIKFCKFVKDIVTQKHKGYGFIEYESSESAKEAVRDMNLFNLGGKLLRVGHAITPLSALKGFSLETNVIPNASVAPAAVATARLNALNAAAKFAEAQSLNRVELPPPGIIIPKLASQPVHNVLGSSTAVHSQNYVAIINQTNVIDENRDACQARHCEEMQKKLLPQDEPESLQDIENVTIKGHNARQAMMQKLRRNIISSVVILKNMVEPEDVDEFLQDDIQEECEKFGKLANVVIFQEKQYNEENAEIIVKIFLHYEAASDAEKARNALNGRYFGGRVVQAKEYDQALFDFGDYSG